MAKKSQQQDKDLTELEDDLIEELQALLGDYAETSLAENSDERIAEIQPPTSVLSDAAIAAAHVFMAFERGYRMSVRSKLKK